MLGFFLPDVAGCSLPESATSWALPAVKPLHARSFRTLRDVSHSRSGCSSPETSSQAQTTTSKRVNDLIKEIKIEELDAYIIPSSDEHLSEYISEHDKRRAFLTGFTGSAGTAVVVASGQRALWTDGRYFLEADQQLDCDWILMKEGVEGVPTIPEWLISTLGPGSVVGADPKLISAVQWIAYDKEMQGSGISFKSVNDNLVDRIWAPEERSVRSDAPIQTLDLNYAGKKWQHKVADVREELKKHNISMLVITAMDETAWLFNLRGGDVPFNPVFRSYTIITLDKIRLFLDRKIGPGVDFHLRVNQCKKECVEIFKYKTVFMMLAAFASLDDVSKVLLPTRYSYTGGASYAIYSAIPEEKREFAVSPVLMMKARKNPVESQGMRNAHRRDAVALIDFLSLMEEEISAGKIWNEISAANRLEAFRSEQADYHSPSFSTISAFGSNGAIIHYRPTPKTNKQITNESLYLLDSGGQYKDGTTDVTRTLHYGTPTKFQKEAYTRVLKGAIDLAAAAFPKGTKDTRLDILARRSLYEVGLDYKHGTGHGIGMFLNVHESPIQLRIYSKEEHDMNEGYFFSDEPGYYKAGEFGIRLETILAVIKRPTKYNDVPMLGLEPITLVPFEPKLIDLTLLERKHCEYLNGYNTRIRKIIGLEFDKQQRTRAKAYMMDRTEPMECFDAGAEDATDILQREQIVQANIVLTEQAPITASSTQAISLAYSAIMFTFACSLLPHLS